LTDNYNQASNAAKQNLKYIISAEAVTVRLNFISV